MTPDILAVIVRGLSFVTLFQAAGAALFAAAFGGHVGVTAPAVHRLARTAAWVALCSIAAHMLLQAARLAGELAGMLDASMQHIAWTSSIATAHAVQALGLVAILIALRPGRMSPVAAAIGASVAILGFLFTGHTSAHPWRIVLAPLLAIHLLVVAFWFGSLLPLWMAAGREPREAAAALLEAFSASAVRLVPLIALAGLAMMWILADGIPSPAEPYGALIAIKLGGFTALMGLAAWNRWRLVPAMRAGEARGAVVLRRSMLAELALIATVLAATAVMTSLFSPEQTG